MPIIHELIVEQHGAFLSKYQGRLRVSLKGEKLLEAPLMHLQQVIIAAQAPLGLRAAAEILQPQGDNLCSRPLPPQQLCLYGWAARRLVGERPAPTALIVRTWGRTAACPVAPTPAGNPPAPDRLPAPPLRSRDATRPRLCESAPPLPCAISVKPEVAPATPAPLRQVRRRCRCAR